MKEVTEERTTEQPQWWPHKAEYWVCWGQDVPIKHKFWQRKSVQPSWRRMFYSAEDAEAHAALSKTHWNWDKQPAVSIAISTVLSRARIKGDLGVEVVSFSDGKWVTVHTYPAGEPLPEELR